MAKSTVPHCRLAGEAYRLLAHGRSKGEIALRVSVWIIGLAVLLGPATAASAQERFVHGDNVNCRSGPDTALSSLERLARNTRVTVAREENGWSLVDRMPECWVSSRFLGESFQSTIAPERRSAPPRSRGGRSGGSAGGRSEGLLSGSSCPCSGSRVCIGPRGGRYCITSGGNKRYGV